MFAFINKLFAGNSKSSLKSSYKPAFDDLESRQLMSVSSAAIHAVAPPTVGAPSTVFYFDSKHLLSMNGQELPQNIRNTPVGIQQFSAGRDAIGDVDVFVQASDKSIWKWNEGDWTKVLSGTNGVTSFAAVNGDRAYAIFGNGSLQEFDGLEWSTVPSSTKVTAIDAITDGRGNDAVFAQNANGTFGEYFGGHFDLMLPAGATTVGTFSAGLDAFGDGIVYGTLFRHEPFVILNLGLFQIGYGSQTFIDNGVAKFSATDGAVWIAQTNGALVKYDAAGLHTEPGSASGIVSLSAANATDVYYVKGSTIDETVTFASGFTEVISYQDFGKVAQ
jgi:hypothetical protein